MRISAVVGGAAVAGVAVLVGVAVLDQPSAQTISTDTPSFVFDTGVTTSSTVIPPTTTTAPPATTAAPTTTQAPTTTTAPPPPLIPAEQRQAIAVKVLNGGAPSGAATSMSAALRTAGFAPQAVATARRPVPATRVLYAAGHELEALTANETVGAAPANLVPATIDDPNWAAFGDKLGVLVVLGPS